MNMDIPTIGQLVKITRGRDAGKYAIVIGTINDKFVLLADGDKRKFDKPKKKNCQHILSLNFVSREVTDSLQDSGRVTNAKLRFAISKYLDDHPSDEKGD
jgi:large subunit ribosomal protein L14e